MELDTGSAVTILNERTWRHVLGKPRLEDSNANLSCYAGHRLKVLGELEAEVKIHGKTEVLYATVVKTGHSSLLGRDWLQALKLDWSEMFAINSVEAESTNAKFEVLLPTFHDVFKVTAQGTTGLAPSELRRKRQRSKRWKMRPDVGKMVEQAQLPRRWKSNLHDATVRDRKPPETIRIRKWKGGNVIYEHRIIQNVLGCNY
jgi:hypothetical protein